MVTGGLMRARMGGHWWSYENQRVKQLVVFQNFILVLCKVALLLIGHKVK